MASIYDPSVRAEALRHGITELQAYRNAQAREAALRYPTPKFPLKFPLSGRN